MKHFKSERLKKLETELHDLEQWLKLGLVPKKDIEKHKGEIGVIQSKIEEEKDIVTGVILIFDNAHPLKRSSGWLLSE